MNKEDIIKELKNFSKKDIEEICQSVMVEKGGIDWDVTSNYFMDATFNEILDIDKTCKFSELSDYNTFEERSDAILWAKKIGAINKLRLIAEKLNGSWNPLWDTADQIKYYICCEKYFDYKVT